MSQHNKIFEDLLEFEEEEISRFNQKLDSENLSRQWSGLNGLADSFRGHAVYSYMIKRDREGFYLDMKKSISYALQLVVQHRAISAKGSARMGVHHKTALLSCLICSDFKLAKRIVDYNRPYAELGNKVNYYQMLYLFCDIMVDSPEKQKDLLLYLNKYIEHSSQYERPYEGYGYVMKGIIQRDESVLSLGVNKVLEDHKSLAASVDGFECEPDAYICLWLLGLLNLAIALGMKVDIDHKYLPKDLLADPKEAQKAWAEFTE
tara:strand:- start:5834 stop:6619 length:786 start_codon:yes stop_codon:yes gene_type:complete